MTRHNKTCPVGSENEKTFAEVALRLGGASEDEARRTGVLDKADDEVETLFAKPYQTASSPAHRAVWDRVVETELFSSHAELMPDHVTELIDSSLAIVRSHRDAGTLYDERDKIADEVLTELGDVGYWGTLVSPFYGGAGATMRQFANLITRMASIEPTVAGLASVHGCIGAVDPLRAFGTPWQKKRFLPALADGSRLSAFALTEPGAGSDLTALTTTAVLDGDDYVVNGEKLFITNAVPGRTIGLVCLIEGKPGVLIVDLPESEDETFQVNRYGLYALRRAHNNGLVFRDFRVPRENRLTPAKGDGLTIAYHGLNLGRVALCANAAGTMRWMLSDMLPWADYRTTYGQAIARRELVRRRVGRMAGLIVACDALTHWCASLLDEGYRGEMECIIAKIFGSEAQKEAAIELYMKTHGGRSFLHGHAFGDNVHDFLAPCIYEGEGEMLGMAFFKSLVKEHGKKFFEPIGQTLHELDVRTPNPFNPLHVWALRGPMTRYAQWMASHMLRGSQWTNRRGVREPFADHVAYAQSALSKSALRVSGVMRRHQLRLVDRQCRMAELSSQIQRTLVVLVTALYGSRMDDEITRLAADVVCHDLRRELDHRPASDADYRRVTELGGMIAERGWKELSDVTPSRIMMPYGKRKETKDHLTDTVERGSDLPFHDAQGVS
ncbi:MAG: acyl-CoA dehydrogenase family protein [Planctomycetota bacterium]